MKISIIIPIYNGHRYLEECIDNLLKQQIKDIQIICVDDGSTDNTLDLLNQYAKQDTRIQVLTQTNQNAGVARNNGLSVATGDYIHFLDVDDWIVPQLYEKTYAVAQQEDSDIVMFNYSTLDESTQVKKEVNLFADRLIQKQQGTYSFKEMPKFFIHSGVMPWNKLYKRTFLEEIGVTFDDLKCANDRAFYYKTIIRAQRITLLSDSLMVYRIGNSGSLIGNNRLKHFHCHFKACESVVLDMRQQPFKIQSLLYDVAIDDVFYFYRRAQGEQQYKLLKQIQVFLRKQYLENTKLIRASRLKYKIMYLLEQDFTNYTEAELGRINKQLIEGKYMNNRPVKQLESIMDKLREDGIKQTAMWLKNRIE